MPPRPSSSSVTSRAPSTLLRALLVVSVVLGTMGAAHADAQRDDGSSFEAYGAFGFAGDGSTRVDVPVLNPVRTTYGFEPTLGFGLRYVVAMGEYFALGGFFEGLTMQPDEGGRDRDWVFDFALRPEVRYAFDVGGFTIEPFVAVPIGFTIAVLEDLDDGHSPHGDEPWPGFNAGVMAGARFLFGGGFGALVEMGWRHHQAWSAYRVLGNDYEVNTTANQFALHVGVLYRL